MYEYRARVVRIVDGDTLHLSVDLGCDAQIKMTVRLYGIDTPEMSTEEGKEAKGFVENWIDTDSSEFFILNTYKDKKEKYGRYLAEISSESRGGVSLNTALLQAGLAVPSKW